MRGDKLNFYGKFFTAENFKMAFRPSGRTIPIYLAAFGSKMTRLAGRMTDGVLINMANPIEIRRIAEEVKRGAEEAGKDPSNIEIICKIRCAIAPSHQAAREALSHALTYYAPSITTEICWSYDLPRSGGNAGGLEVRRFSCGKEVRHGSAFRGIAPGRGNVSG
jgi:alkanesulfonate monooxygenase SsuD/methylene tetrahydromethanopterin reductase-like flavin-dependent oxidoreductase (luciferase family)